MMVSVCKLLLVAALLLCLQAQLSISQHWSHGWYPGGKREIDSYSSPEISGEIKLCEAGECSYLRPLRTNILKSILLDALAKEFQKRK
ncbi:progonadoliberin-2 [Silurus meridionalis]|uniref:progonadoliberin-2 n=1 Tax=Silurus meridionalis TaxID=175797 RepID=UPI001EEAED4D|nr:progonadoliberin-2 [Silurus meridionalis]